MSIVHFIGAGPGDPELITVKGARILGESDLVIYAGSLVDRELVRRFAPDSEVHDSSSMTLEETTEMIAEAVIADKSVVRLHTGDPSLYGAIQEQMAELDRLGIDYAVVPGVTSAFAAAASLKQELTLPEVSQTLVFTRLEGRTPVPERESLQQIAKTGATLAIYLSVSMIGKVVEVLLQGAYTLQTPAAVVSRASWPDELIIRGTLSDIAFLITEAGIDRQAVILVGDVLNARTSGLKAKSLLYDKEFSHGCRKGIKG
ncbi:MAG: precorrin-4 C(11)-methyltransferase [Geobacteraceae bacterium]|nr:precorrin-4 C(11)-methyltransferase [Geobacteraceae bacterium]